MKHFHRAAAVAIAGMLALATPGIAFAADADVIREAQDRAEIQQLMWDYARAIDNWDADRYVAVFTPDGAFGGVKGRDALHKMVVDAKNSSAERSPDKKPALLHHMEGNQNIEFVDKDHARVHYYWITVSGAGPQPPLPVVLAVGNGLDDVVRVNGKWLLQTRQVVAKE